MTDDGNILLPREKCTKCLEENDSLLRFYQRVDFVVITYSVKVVLELRI